MSGVIGGAVAGAVGGGLAVTVLAPLTAANNFLGSYFFGSGMILGERQMYQDDWIKIKKRLDAGESFLVILEEVMKPNTQAVMQMARETVIAVSDEWNKIVLDYVQSIPQTVWDALLKLGGDVIGGNVEWPLGEGVIGIKDGVPICHADYEPGPGNTCVLIESSELQPPDEDQIIIDDDDVPSGLPPGEFKVLPATQKVYNDIVDKYNEYTEEYNTLTKLLGQATGAKRTAIVKRRKWLDVQRTSLKKAQLSMEKSYPGIKYTG